MRFVLPAHDSYSSSLRRRRRGRTSGLTIRILVRSESATHATCRRGMWSTTRRSCLRFKPAGRTRHPSSDTNDERGTMPTFLAILIAVTLHGRVLLDYTLRVDQADLSTYDVTMRIRNVPDTFTVAYAAHPEYDNKYWRYIENLTVTAGTAV